MFARVSFLRSSIVRNSTSPCWSDEWWFVRNVPDQAVLTIEFFDRDEHSKNDDFIGTCRIHGLWNFESKIGGEEIRGNDGKNQGFFQLNIFAEATKAIVPRYLFDGPTRVVRNDSPIVDSFAFSRNQNGFSTWKIYLRCIELFFTHEDFQHWNKNYPIAQEIFGSSAKSLIKQNTFKLAHQLLYSRSMKNSQIDRVESAEDFWKIFLDRKSSLIQPCLYTFVLDQDSFRFSETGASFLKDFASKHAFHAYCAEQVLYAGQFHPRPKFGWDRCDSEWEMVFDNWSGTYSPSPDLFIKLRQLFELNFPGVNVITHHFKEPPLRKSINDLVPAMSKTIGLDFQIERFIDNMPVIRTENDVYVRF